MSFLILAALTMQVQIFTAQPEPPRARPSTQAEAGATTPDGRAGDAGEPEVIQICRTVPVTGSRFPRRICRSERQDQADRNESQDMLRNYQGLPELIPGLSTSPKGTGSAGPL